MRLVIFSLAAGVAMWLLGFVLYSLMFNMGWSTAPEATQLAIQEALRALPGSGTYVIPTGETPAMLEAYAAGPIAQVNYSAVGYPAFSPMVLLGGLFQFAVVAAMIGWLLDGTSKRLDLVGRIRLVLGMAAVAVVYIHLADPIWYHGDWRNALYKSFADFIILGTGGLIMARWYVLRRSNRLGN